MQAEDQAGVRKPLPLPAIIGLYVLFSLCACAVGVAVLRGVGTIGVNLGAGGSAVVEAESLAYELVYNNTTAERSTVERLQRQKLDDATDRYAVLMGYQLADGPHQQLIVVEVLPDDIAVIQPVNEVTAGDEHLTATARFDPTRFDGDVSVYGQILDPAITRVDVFWPGDSAISAPASLIDNSLLLFLPWNPIDGTGLPANLIAYDENDGVVTVLTWPQPET